MIATAAAVVAAVAVGDVSFVVDVVVVGVFISTVCCSLLLGGR